MRPSRGENSFSKKTFTRVFENEFGPRERKPRKKKQSRFFSPRDYDQIKRITKRTCVESRFSVVECPRRFATSAIARLFLSPRSRWMPFPITLRFTPFSFFSLFFSLCFLFQIFCSSLPLLFFRGPSFAFENFCLSRNLTRPPLILFFNARAIRSFFPIFFAPNEANVIEPIKYRWI